MRDLDKLGRILKKEILSLNRHVPKRRKTLKELLEEKKPHVIGLNGKRHRFKKNELKLIASILSPEEYEKIKLPIYLEMGTSTSGIRIRGKLESRVILYVLGKEKEIDELKNKNEIYIYKPELRIVRQKLPTTTQYIFVTKGV
ncbi:Protein of unknown function DUF61 [Methanothermus fervidus DSM 2088]|uniref:UPF0216 protein Mfer_0931 n=1 Tax=Methanothermus fervidus (strain ATCC 43054 / DSM 2088 / JCM 10308 / V24 S) TaxID=523846 RepID=E3GZJ7_METFV|nr:DUF61 family protein [Methanothermus fervidus]ADP77729.1 Protein of unknown function DUF61 [Methanothermus fervidus DSM 2088]